MFLVAQGVHVDRLITVCYLPFNLIVLALLIHYHGVISARLRVVAGFAVFTLAAAAMPLLDSFPAGSGSLALMLILVATCGIADGAAQGALFGEAAARDPRYIQALVAGTAIAGTAVSGLRILTKAALPATPEGLRTSENLYFLTTAILCAACGFVYSAVLPRLHKRQLWNSPSVEVVAVVSNMNDAEANGAAADQGNSFIHIESLGMERSPEYGAVSNIEEVADSLLRAPSKGDAYHHQPHSSNTSSPEPYFPLRISYLDVAWQVRWFALSVVLVYVVTLSIFPGVLAEDITSGRIGTWYPVLLIALFNVADLAGKWLPALPSCRFKGRDKIGIAALARIAFVPAFHFAGEFKKMQRGRGYFAIAHVHLYSLLRYHTF